MKVNFKRIKFPKLESISTFVSLVIAIVSLIISVIALRISERTYIFSSKDYTPNIQFSIDENDNIELTNISSDLFSIDMINFLKIKIVGYEDYESKVIVEIPYVDNSLLYQWIDDDGKAEKVIIKSKTPGPCAYICKYDESLIKSIEAKIDSLYSIGSERGYALPSLQSQFYILEVVYTDNFQERKSVVYLQEHIHGFGYDKTKIQETEFNEILNRVNLPKFKDGNELWDYVTHKYSTPSEKYFGKYH